MMKHPVDPRIDYDRCGGIKGDTNGHTMLTHKGSSLSVRFSEGMGWDHISISLRHRCPTWEEMCWVKNLFFDPDDVVMQLHPAKSQYVNYHPYCLHLWRPQTAKEMQVIKERWGNEWPYGDCQPPGAIPTPPPEFVGPRDQSRGRPVETADGA